MDPVGGNFAGAAVAQVCAEYKMPFSVIRTISDAGDESAHQDFGKFLKNVASIYSTEILRRLLITTVDDD